jgi:hypothetical protein
MVAETIWMRGILQVWNRLTDSSQVAKVNGVFPGADRELAAKRCLHGVRLWRLEPLVGRQRGDLIAVQKIYFR